MADAAVRCCSAVCLPCPGSLRRRAVPRARTPPTAISTLFNVVGKPSPAAAAQENDSPQMTSFLVGISKLLAPGALEQPALNDGFAGTEWRLGSWAAIRPAAYPYEPWLVALVLAYTAWFFLGRSWNQSIATAWCVSLRLASRRGLLAELLSAPAARTS